MSCVFVIEEPSDQGNRMDINLDQQIVDVTDKNPQGQVPGGQHQDEGSLAAVPLLSRDHNPEEEFRLLMKKKKRAQLKIKI